MSLTTREPCTKFFGPNARVRHGGASNGIYIQLFDVKPGALWVPGLETEMYTRRYLPCHPDYQVYQLYTPNFAYGVTWSFTDCKIQIYCLAPFALAFQFKPHYAVNEWMICQIPGPENVFSFGGRMVVSWVEGP